MRIEFNRTGAERKALVTAMGEILEVKPRYLGMPTAAYEVDYFTIDRNGTVEFDDRADSEEIENLLEALANRGFVAEPQETAEDAPEKETASDTAVADTEPQGENVGLTVAIPLENVAVGNLTKLLDAKGGLIKKALGIDELPIEIGEDKVSFPWFSELPDADEVQAYTHFISALCEMAKNAKRVTATEKEVDNEKYAFRCFLLRLGFIGAEYKTERKILLKNLSGSSAFKSGERKEAVSDAVSE
jgi:hypothetical protein|nr:MAG TPA: Putative amidoligase enzyme [Caudoviricetes sp.]